MSALLTQAMDANTGGYGGWQRAAGNPILSGGVTWEANAPGEPSVIYESGTWKMWYSGGWNSPGVGYATCTGDPTVAANWTKYAGNPVLGQGGSSIAGYASGPSVFKFGSTYYLYYYTASGGGNTKVSTSTDGTTWTTPVTVLTAGTPSWAKKWAGDLSVWKEGSTWKMLACCSLNAAGGPQFATAYVTSTNSTPDGGWTVQGSGPLTDLAVPGNSSAVYGNVRIMNGGAKVADRYQAWFHAGNGSNSDIYHAWSTDAVAWTVTGVELTHNGGTYEKDQAADAYPVEVNGTSYLFYSGVDNPNANSYVNVATWPGTLEQRARWL